MSFPPPFPSETAGESNPPKSLKQIVLPGSERAQKGGIVGATYVFLRASPASLHGKWFRSAFLCPQGRQKMPPRMGFLFVHHNVCSIRETEKGEEGSWQSTHSMGFLQHKPKRQAPIQKFKHQFKNDTQNQLKQDSYLRPHAQHCCAKNQAQA